VAIAAVGWVDPDRPVAFSQMPGTPDSPVVLELFTSQGCSSCPPADALLSQLGSSKSVIPLAYHVDYWNHLGWTDPFSSSQFSNRQTAYARAMNLRGEYTPQMVIQGQSDCVGSDSRCIARAIDGVRSLLAPARVSVRARLELGSPRVLQIDVGGQFKQAQPSRPFLVMLAIFENGLTTQIERGENGGRLISYDYTVRKLLPVAYLDGASVQKDLSVEVDPSWSVDHLGVAAFIQDPVSLGIHGAASEYPLAKN
jgi:hypothetical protein